MFNDSVDAHVFEGERAKLSKHKQFMNVFFSPLWPFRTSAKDTFVTVLSQIEWFSVCLYVRFLNLKCRTASVEGPRRCICRTHPPAQRCVEHQPAWTLLTCAEFGLNSAHLGCSASRNEFCARFRHVPFFEQCLLSYVMSEFELYTVLSCVRNACSATTASSKRVMCSFGHVLHVDHSPCCCCSLLQLRMLRAATLRFTFNA